MVVTWRVGAESSSGSVAYATYLQGETLKHEREAATRYYLGEIAPQPTTRLEELAQAIDRGTVGYAEGWMNSSAPNWQRCRPPRT
jgi:hypothetical protein